MRKIKKGTRGEKTQYLTRSKAIRKLQLTLKDFRRLSILKGVYPREPKRKFEGTNKIYYHIKDLKILQHDKLLQKFRDIKAHLKKHKKLLGKKETKLAEDHLKMVPKYTLSHVIKERYPTFIDALRDLDDALCLLSLFASFPQHLTLEISKKEIETCGRLVKEFMLYCTVTQCFKKSFYSIKGIYYQVEIMGQNITWVAPY
jgi:pescadillo protein